MSWQCQVTAESTPANGQPITVGESFGVTCSGGAVALKKDQLRLVAGTEVPNKFRLVLQEVQELSEAGAKLRVTSYVVGSHKAEGVVLTDGENFVQLEGFGWDVKTVIEQQPGQQPQPIGPFGPWRLSVPLWYWLVLILILLLVGWRTWRTVKRRNQRKRLFAELSTHKTARLPFDEFHHDLRQFERRFHLNPEAGSDFVKELNRIFRMYLIREFRVPALQWSTREILAEMKRYHAPVFKVCGTELGQVLTELERAVAAGPRLSALDREQILKMCRSSSENLFKAKAAEKGAR